VYFELGQYNLSWEMLDKALRLGAPLGARVCRERSFRSCEQGVFMLSNKEASFTNAKKKQVFAAPPSEVESHPAERQSFSDAAYTWLKVDGKNYRLFLIPEAVQCQIGTAVVCTEPGFTQQKVFANYVHHAIEGLVSGTLARPEPPPQPARQPVVPGGSIGEFRHETLVISGSWVVAQTPQEATHTHPGVDIAAECGKPVYALTDGTVIDIVSEREKEYEWLGYTIIIKHAEPIGDTDTYSAYIHMNEPPAVRWDQPVVAGQTQIGVVGKTGVATGCHLHLEVRHFGSRFLEDPEWNQPWNIYGLGDQRDSPILSENWENPELLGIPLI
jgi:murein DD-endopeptidase MepM/ murein hydrolase activator NlpD